ncbi:MAG: hypothetical protein HY238_27250 [Acidobacteria bacterium]|nr:hypothetical protein [Acidobacteriota bacterium]
MDTRTKIIDLDQAKTLAARRPLTIAHGAFDVLLVDHARALSRLCSPDSTLLVVVYQDAPILNPQARALLVAALACVDYVLVWPQSSLDSVLQDLRPARVEQVPDERNIIVEIQKRHVV